MRLTLTYDGPLHAATRRDSRTAEKNQIRKRLHPQLLDAWQTHPALSEGALLKDFQARPLEQRYDCLQPNHFLVGHRVDRYGFIPIVTRRHFMHCELDVLFLRREKPGSLVHGGDLDNRLKVLFDALSIPTDATQLAGLNDNEPDPFCCLLDDDQLITGLNLRTAQLHEPPELGDNEANVRLIIEVTIRVSRLTFANLGIGT